MTNLRAGSRGDGKPRELIDVPTHPDLVHVVTETSAHLPGALAELAAKEVGVIAINGGDGTLHRALTELMRARPFETQPFVAPLRGGRTNMTALDFGAARSPSRSVRRLFEACRRGELEDRRVDRPLLRIHPDTASAPLFGFFVGTGIVRRSIEYIHRVFPPGRARGVFGGGVTAASVVMQAVMGRRNEILAPDKHQLILDGEAVEPSEYLLVMATSLDRLFLRIRPFWGEAPEPVHFTAIDWNAANLGTSAWRVAAGRGGAAGRWTPLSRERGYLSQNVRDVVIRHDCGFTIDGELFRGEGEGSLRIGATRDIPFLRG